MLGSKLLPMASVARVGILGNGMKQFTTSAIRRGGHGEWTYRSKQAPPLFNVRFANCCGAFMWWWVWWHVFSDYGHMIGHFEFPDASTWTNQELGIPPDDAEDP